MKIKDYISKSIQGCPVLFKDIDYEKSKLKVLDQIFFIIGNGLKFAETKNKNKEEGGYLVIPKYIDDGYNYKRLKDKPYGQIKFKEIPEDYFESTIYYVGADESLIETYYQENMYGNDDVYFRCDTKNILSEPKVRIAENIEDFTPSPIYDDCIFYQIYYNNTFLQDDWLQELIILCKRTLDYYNDENQYKNNRMYGTEYWHDFRERQINFLSKFLDEYKNNYIIK